MTRLAPLVAPAVLAAALALPGCRRAEGAAPAAEPPAGAAGSAVRLAVPEKVRFAPPILASGTLRAEQSAPLAFPVAGTLQKVLVRRGQAVGAGAVLAQLDDAAARAAVAQAEAGVGAAQAQARLAQDVYDRTSRIRREEGASESQLVQAESQRDLEQARALAARAQLEQARVSLARHTLRAPFAGAVVKVPDGVGLAVAAGVPLFALEGTGRLLLETTVTPEEAAAIRAGARVSLVVPATGAGTSQATVRAIVPTVEASTGRVPVEVLVSNADGRFLPHASARVQFPNASEQDAFAVPAAALVQRQGGYSLWVVGEDGRAGAVPVRVLGQEGDRAVVDPGPGAWPAGSRVVEAPPIGIAEGTRLPEARSP